MENKKYNMKAIIKYAGAFIAWVVGSGFDTGQELLQFFASYGFASYGVVLINLFGFLLIGKILMTKGFDYRDDKDFNHYKYYCGKKLGAIYSLIVPLTLLAAMTVLIAASGATLYEHYGINSTLGSAAMALAVLIAYLVGFENLVKVVSKIGPIIIMFALVVGTISIVRDFSSFGEIEDHLPLLELSQPAPNWIISGILYVSFTFFVGAPYYCALGKSAQSRSDAKWGAIVGALALCLVIAIINTAILLNAETAASLYVPTLYLTQRISPMLSTLFSILLILGIFSSCSTMMWSFCSKMFKEGSWKNRLIATITAIVVFTVGLFFSFRELLGILYPINGYIGLIFIVCVIFKSLKMNNHPN